MKLQTIKESKNKNEYEESIKNFADALDQRLTFLKEEKSKVEKSAMESYESKVQYITSKRNEVETRLEEIKSTSQAKWNETYSAVHQELTKISSEADEVYVGLTNGFDYLFKKMKS